jgi:sulfur relay protein TusB/DsrH
MLHVITDPVWDEGVLQRLSSDDKVLFLNAALLSTVAGGRREAALHQLPSTIRLFVLSEHLAIYGISPERLFASITVIDYAQFVALSIEQTSVQTWS